MNAEKSAVARPWERKFLGYSMTWHREPQLRIAPAERATAEERSCGKSFARARTQPDAIDRAN